MFELWRINETRPLAIGHFAQLLIEFRRVFRCSRKVVQFASLKLKVQQDEWIKARTRSPFQGNIWEGGRRKLYSLFKFASTSFCFQTKFAPKVISSENLRIDIDTDFIRLGKSGKLCNFFFFFNASTFPNLMERDRIFFRSKLERFSGRKCQKSSDK